MGAALSGTTGITMNGFVQHHNNHNIVTGVDDADQPIEEPCSGHSVSGTQKVASASKVFINGKPAVLVGDTGQYSCPCHIGDNVNYTISIGSSKVFINGKAAVRSGDKATLDEGSEGTLSGGSSNVFIGG